jgi:hypothetical protein
VSYASVDELAFALNRPASDDVAAVMQMCLDAAALEIDQECDRPADDPIPPGDALANRVNVARAVEWWKAADAAFGVVGFEQSGVLNAPRDGFNRHAAALSPLKRRWGIA